MNLNWTNFNILYDKTNDYNYQAIKQKRAKKLSFQNKFLILNLKQLCTRNEILITKKEKGAYHIFYIINTNT